ncbi:hypothetical protein K435DRAFT_800890 [Dendrothele bispora CBS 962.96]|uniref:Uncharacterized protein n=1 Tax=Dendrothele bispora (strain CBS 962.96) TaxID=1314807 RepID=A0A4S8LR71_DENBC|nr:hypothetical protein K435DRAFT_800890 [Dendrothele bispora CBS 962.96]
MTTIITVLPEYLIPIFRICEELQGIHKDSAEKLGTTQAESRTQRNSRHYHKVNVPTLLQLPEIYPAKWSRTVSAVIGELETPSKHTPRVKGKGILSKVQEAQRGFPFLNLEAKSAKPVKYFHIWVSKDDIIPPGHTAKRTDCSGSSSADPVQHFEALAEDNPRTTGDCKLGAASISNYYTFLGDKADPNLCFNEPIDLGRDDVSVDFIDSYTVQSNLPSRGPLAVKSLRSEHAETCIDNIRYLLCVSQPYVESTRSYMFTRRPQANRPATLLDMKIEDHGYVPDSQT